MQRWWTTGGLAAAVLVNLASSTSAQNPIRQPGPRPVATAAPVSPPAVPAANASNPTASSPAAQPPNAVAGQAAAQSPAAPLAPEFMPLSADLDRFVDQILQAWEKSTKDIKRYRCSFVRWQYDTTKITNPEQFHAVASGVIRYMAPDKGMFKVEDERQVVQVSGEYKLENSKGQIGEHWICDGESVYQYDESRKVAKKYQLPAQMRGKQVFNSPLPFFFGVEAQKVRERYWVNPIKPEKGADGKQIYIVDVYPKFQADAMNYHHVRVFLDEAEFLPLAIHVHSTNWSKESPNREIYEFRDRERIRDGVFETIKEAFSREFIPKEPPKDWTVEEGMLIPDEHAVQANAGDSAETPTRR